MIIRDCKHLIELQHIYMEQMDDDIENKKAKGTKKCIIKRRIMFENYIKIHCSTIIPY